MTPEQTDPALLQQEIPRQQKQLYIDRYQPPPGKESGEHPPQICGHQNAAILHYSINGQRHQQHTGCYQRGRENKPEGNGRQFSYHNSRTPGAERKLISFDVKTAFGQLVASGKTADLH